MPEIELERVAREGFSGISRLTGIVSLEKSHRRSAVETTDASEMSAGALAAAARVELTGGAIADCVPAPVAFCANAEQGTAASRAKAIVANRKWRKAVFMHPTHSG